MKQQLLLILLFVCSYAAGQPTIDGTISTGEGYTIVGTFTSGNDGFGANNELGSIYYTYRTATAPGGVGTLYIGVTGKIDAANNIVLFMDFSNYLGRSTGILGGATTSNLGVFSTTTNSGDCSGNGGLNGARMGADFDADYAFAFNEGNTTTNLFCDAMRFSALGSSPDGYFEQGSPGSVNQTGTPGTFALPFMNGCGSCPGSITFAYKSNYDASTMSSSGIEMRIPYRALPGVAPGDYVKFFAIITNQFGFMSNEMIPGGPVASNPGCDFNLASLGQTLYTSLYLLPNSILKFDAAVQQNSIALDWKVSNNEELKQFDVERSSDGINFTTISTIVASTMTGQKAYQFLDANPVSGWNFYRLRTFDFKNQYKQSQIVRVWIGKKTGKPSVYPNPVVNNQINFSTNGLVKGIYNLQVISVDGKQMIQNRWVFDGTQAMHTIEIKKETSPGMYWLVLRNESGETIRMKLLK